MLKVSRNLFRWTKEMIYADYYKQALTNGVLSIRRETEPGVMIYMLPLGHGVSKRGNYHCWGTQFNFFWCCYRTDSHSKRLRSYSGNAWDWKDIHYGICCQVFVDERGIGLAYIIH